MRVPLSPHDTTLSAVLRFVLELAALFAIGAAFGLFNFLISVFALALFNAKGDKRFQGIQISGAVRVIIEIGIAILGIYGAGVILGTLPMVAFAFVWICYLYLGRDRLLWLARGARAQE